MMKITTKGRYSVRLMIDLAIHGTQSTALLKDIARRQEISEKYLGHLVPLLKNAGLIHATRGAHGGFNLAVPAEKITLKDIISAVEGPICLVGCVADSSICKRTKTCTVKDFWGEATNQIIRILESFTLADIAQQQKDRSENLSYDI